MALEFWERLWALATRKIFDVGELATFTRLLRDELCRLHGSQHSAELHRILDLVTESLGAEHYPALQAFWKNFHAQPIRSRAAAELEAELLSFASRFCLDRASSSAEWGLSLAARSASDIDVKHSVLEALASLRSLDCSQLLVQEDLRWLRDGLPVLLSTSTNSITPGSNESQAAIWPMADYILLRNGSSFLQTFLQVLSNNVSTPSTVPNYFRISTIPHIGFSPLLGRLWEHIRPFKIRQRPRRISHRLLIGFSCRLRAMASFRLDAGKRRNWRASCVILSWPQLTTSTWMAFGNVERDIQLRRSRFRRESSNFGGFAQIRHRTESHVVSRLFNHLLGIAGNFAWSDLRLRCRFEPLIVPVSVSFFCVFQ